MTTVRGRRRPGERVRRAQPPPDEPDTAGEEPPGPTRRRYLVRRWTVLAVLAGILGVGCLVLFTSLLGVSSVDVVGTKTVSPDAVRAAAAIEPGTPLARLDTDEVAARVGALPKVGSVTVSRSWPTTIEIQVTERAPVAMVTAPDGVHLIDATGLDYETVKAPPPAMPELALATIHPDDPSTRAAIAVLAAIPRQLSAQVVKITARTPGNVQLTLADGRTVTWGSPDDSPRKSAVLAPLLTRPGTVYDVATPDFPTVS